MKFPDFLDGVRILEYTERGHFGFMTDYDENDIPIEKEVCYKAIGRYCSDECGFSGDFYIFSCDKDFNVINDGYLWRIEDCKTCFEFWETAIWHKK